MTWTWGSTDAARAARAGKVKVVSLNDGVKPSISCEGSDGSRYSATLESCTCPDFNMNMRKGKPTACKHMVCLAMRLGLLNKEGRTPSDQFLYDLGEAENRLAKYAWYYYVLKAPLVSDAEYDALKAKYMKWREML